MNVESINRELEVLGRVGDTLEGVRYGMKISPKTAKLSRVLRSFRLVSGFSLISNLFYATEKARGCFKASTNSARFDYSLHTLSAISAVMYNLSAFAMGMRDIGWVTKGATSWANKLMAISVPLQVASFVVNIREWRKTNRLAKELRNTPQNKITELFDKKETEYGKLYFEEHFLVDDPEAFKKSLRSINSKKEKALHNRLWSKKLSNALQTLAVVVSLAATIVFLFSPLATIGYLLFSLGCVMEVAIWVHDYAAQRRFCKEMEMPFTDLLVVRAVCPLQDSIYSVYQKVVGSRASLAEAR